jgi:tetratricopeptide (TPR) repeat protein/TolB-like protein
MIQSSKISNAPQGDDESRGDAARAASSNGMRARSAGPKSPPRLADTETNLELAPLSTGMLLAGRYRILAEIGAGGMGIVYKARDEELGLDIAVKVLRPDLGTDPECLERFRRELILAREVTHENVVRIHDIGESEGFRFLTMRLIEGRSLLEVIENDGPLPADRALRVFHQVAEALQQAHDARVVHRDLKPANILLAHDETAYVTDFGIARSLVAGAWTRSGAIVGTLDYLSPEQAAGESVDGRSDIYALGVVLFEMLTGELPFRQASLAETMAQRLTGRARDIRETGVQVPAHVAALVRRCLERSPARRPASARDAIALLDAGSVSVLDRLPRLTRSSRAALLAGAALILAVLAAGVGVTYFRSTPGPDEIGLHSQAPVGVAVLPLADETGDPSFAWVSTGVAEMLTTHLAEVPQLRVLDSARVQRTLRDLKLTDGARDDAVVRRIAELLEVRHVVAGAVRHAGGTWRIDLRLLSFAGPGRDPIEAQTIAAQTSDAGGVFDVVGQVAERLRVELGLDRLPGSPAPPVQSTSLEAAAGYRDGRERLLVGNSVGAADAFERAVAADPHFAEAHEGLSEAYQALGYHDKAVSAAQTAVETLGSAKTRLAWQLRARLALLRGEPHEAEEAFAELVRRYPNDTKALVDLSVAQASRGAVTEAVATLRKVTELDSRDARAWFLLGKNMILAGDAREALTDPLVRALALMTQLGNDQGRADVLNAMGVAHQRLGEYPQAIENYGEASSIRVEIGDERGVAVSLKNRASVHLAMGNTEEVEADLRAAREIYETIGHREGLADVWNDFGFLHEGRGEYAEARKAYQEALRIRRELGDEQKLAQSYDNLGYAFFLEGEHDNAVVYWQQALDLHRKIGDKAGIVLTLQNMGFLQTTRGRWSEAMKSFLDTLEQSREIDFKKALAVSHGNIGLLHQYYGRYTAALSSYAEALDILRELGDKRGLAEFTLKESAALMELGRRSEAKVKLDAAASWVRETGNREQTADYQAALGEWHLANGDRELAEQALNRAVEEATVSRSPAAVLRATLARDRARVLSGEAAAAARELASTVREAEALGDVLLRIRASEVLASAELARGRTKEAETWARSALELADRSGWEAGLHRLHALIGRIREKTGDTRGADAAYRESARHLDRVREGLSETLRSSFDTLPSVREVEEWTSKQAAGSQESRLHDSDRLRIEK